MSEPIPVNPVMLRWARETGGYGIDDVVDKLKRKRITSETILSWEKGIGSPTYVAMNNFDNGIYCPSGKYLKSNKLSDELFDLATNGTSKYIKACALD